MKRNEGTVDRVLRAAAAIAAIAAATVIGVGSVVGVVLVVVGVVLAVTAATGFCPLYRVLGVSTCPVRRAPAEREHVRAS